MIKKISCIIPAYNEEKRISSVLKVVTKSALIDEIIVVNDGSTDSTLKAIRKFGTVNVITYSSNRGKSFAVMRGLNAARNDTVLLLDADLGNITQKNLSDIIGPVIRDECDMTLEIHKNPFFCRIFGINFLSGTRVFRKSILPYISVLKKISGYALEIYLDKIALRKNLRLRVVTWYNVIAPYKTTKQGLFKGWSNELKMNSEINKEAGFSNFVYTTIYYSLKMRRLLI